MAHNTHQHDEHGHPQDGHPQAGHPQVGHVVSFPILLGVALALMLLTWVTVAATWIDLGPLNVWVALLIATVKAALVVLYFMHLRYDAPFNAVVFITSLLFMALFISLALMDVAHYQYQIIVP